MEFKGTKEEKALQHAKKCWGVYFDDVHSDCAINNTVGEISQEDFLAGYNQALEDSKAPKMLEMLKLWCMDMEERGRAYGDCYEMTKQLIKEATEL